MRTLRRLRHTWCGYIKVDLEEIGLGDWLGEVGLDSYGTG